LTVSPILCPLNIPRKAEATLRPMGKFYSITNYKSKDQNDLLGGYLQVYFDGSISCLVGLHRLNALLGEVHVGALVFLRGLP